MGRVNILYPIFLIWKTMLVHIDIFL